LLGEVLDSLKAFGLRANHPLIIRGTKYLLASQNEDGSWGDPMRKIFARGVTRPGQRSMAYGLYAWRGERLSRPELKSLLKGSAD